MDALQITFLNAAGTVLFSRNDMEQGNWTQEEYTVNATFPYRPTSDLRERLSTTATPTI